MSHLIVFNNRNNSSSKVQAIMRDNVARVTSGPLVSIESEESGRPRLASLSEDQLASALYIGGMCGKRKACWLR
jgi:hypothetical protein